VGGGGVGLGVGFGVGSGVGLGVGFGVYNTHPHIIITRLSTLEQLLILLFTGGGVGFGVYQK
jgi:hypothetical protein